MKYDFLNFCFPDIDECASDPCMNGATCVDRLNMYTCDCDAGYKGTHCETGTFQTKTEIMKIWQHTAETEFPHLNFLVPVGAMPLGDMALHAQMWCIQGFFRL